MAKKTSAPEAAPEASSAAGTPPAEPILPLEQEAAKKRDEKPFIVVAVFPTKSDGGHHHAAQIKAHLSQLGVEAQIVKTLQGDETHLLVDASAGLTNEVVE